MLPEILLVLALILANGFFSGAEMAIVASRRGRLRQLADAGDKAAQTALQLASSPDQFLPTVQIGITLVGTLAAAYGGDSLVSDLAEWITVNAPPAVGAMARPIALTVFVVLLSFVTLLFGELVPKRLALRRAEAFARAVAPAMQVFARSQLHEEPQSCNMHVSGWELQFFADLGDNIDQVDGCAVTASDLIFLADLEPLSRDPVVAT